MNIYVSLTTEELDASGFKTKAELREYITETLDGAPRELEGFDVVVMLHGPSDVQRQWRVYGMISWQNCSEDWFEHCRSSTRLDTRTIPIPDKS